MFTFVRGYTIMFFFFLIIFLCACSSLSALYRELTIPQEKSQLISQLQILSAQVSQKPKIASLQTLVALWIAGHTDLFNDTSTACPLPVELDELLTKYVKHRHAVQLFQKMPLNPEIQEIHSNVRFLHIGPDRKFLFIDHEWCSCQTERTGTVYERAGSIYAITETGLQLLGMIPGNFSSITHDNNYACLEQDDKSVIIELPSLNIVAEYNDEFGDDHYLAFDPIGNTCFLIRKLIKKRQSGTRIFGYAFDEEESRRFDPEMYVFQSRSTAYQWKQYLACLHNQPHALAQVPPYRSSLHSLTTAYWNDILDRYIEEHGIEIKRPRLDELDRDRSGSITPDGRYCAWLYKKDAFFILDLQHLESFDMKKNYFKLGKKDGINPKEIEKIAISPHGTMLLIFFYYIPPEMKQRDVHEGKNVLCLYDIATRDWCVLTELVSGWPDEGFWFSEDGNSIDVYSGRDYRRYDLENLAPARSFGAIVAFLSAQHQHNNALKNQKTLI